ncbi:MAG: redox-sensing transcriptional repressor Rex [Candidatus Hydrogenedentes bacterium]|nr:redox-sensing transcriptional repressor Rex [Candidatus Hydrogenedentota bacterium]
MTTVQVSPQPDVKHIPEPTLRRLPAYHHYLKGLASRGREVVSCSRIGTELRLDPTQVRKDLAATGIIGRPKVGYPVTDLIESIEAFLGWKNVTDAFVVGAGSLGTALIHHQSFNQYGLNIVAAFDKDPEKIGKTICGKEVLAVEKLPSLAARMHVHIGIVTTPADAAQEAADLLVFGGVKAIWNFTPASLTLPESVIVQNEDLFASFAVLSSKLKAALGVAPAHSNWE